MHIIYILYNPTIDKYYIGETNDIKKRMIDHDEGNYEKSYTSYRNGWELKKQMSVSNRVEARKIETYIKNMKSKKFLFQLINDESYYIKFKELVMGKFDIEIRD